MFFATGQDWGRPPTQRHRPRRGRRGRGRHALGGPALASRSVYPATGAATGRYAVKRPVTGVSRPWVDAVSATVRAYSAFPQVNAVSLCVLSARAPEKMLDGTLHAQDQLFGPPRGLAWGSPSDLGTPVGGPPLATRLTITVPLSEPSRGDVLFSRIRSFEAARWKYPRS